ncbi:LPXTG cell wall anchor domain-containing protein [Rhizorhapis sp.]|uniref:LPXTG cell wall anchor domain-containing protein n=1 Tax=Rhizorhapis sp. TaxID=1968842 RepID=UPI002B45A95D|nr:LPXTG cell wall anchor domain-containing protein [Rhizorhapis sp.]HKR15962.1 LPXTG cell wall anchor domain-containing protein [Rhizorhapis sp.]HKX35981.1 LPXTG cell wall anchor domain-containing protein [Rhizorhapis sp.]
MRNRRTGRSSSRSTIVWIILIALLAGALWYLWQRGGEQPQTRVEKVISQDRFAQ